MRYEFRVIDLDYKYSPWQGGNESIVKLLTHMDAEGWELVTSHGDGRYRSQQDRPTTLIFRRPKPE